MRRLLPAAVLLVVGALYAPPATPPSAARASLAARVETAVRKKRHKDVRVSLAVWDAESGRRLAFVLPETRRRTASVMKLVTTAGALTLLGPEHELTTVVRTTAEPRTGVVDGDLVVEGHGDPGFSTHLVEDGVEAELLRFARGVRDAGVTRVTGDLLIDTSAFPGPARHPGWGWEGEHHWYMAPATAVTLSDACLDVTVLPGSSPGARARLHVAPPTTLVDVANRITTTTKRKEHSIAFVRSGVDAPITARGRVWSKSTGYTASLAWIDPPAVFGDVFRRCLAAEGVEIAGETRILRGPPAAPWPRSDDRPGRVVAVHGTRLADAVDVTNRRSQNLWAELILRHCGLVDSGDGSSAGGARAVARALALDAQTLTQADGSGLARENTATVGAIGSVLLRMYESSHRIEFMDSLARGGDPDGTLRKRFRAKRFENRVLGKTGTLRDTSALAGFVLAGESRVLAFAILCEGAPWRARDLQDAVVAALIDG